MRIDRAAKFGVVATALLLPISVAAVLISRPVLESSITDNTVVVFVAIGASVVNMTFLFALVGLYLDRELAARGLASSDGE
ncbi:hypothetical protein N0B31_18790 [Salinirubellus salinus]|uniref:Uncharacterized protein n=1 Tax=Salinirubellus salinus TaxID=1364945 RepID=A0A9E7U805_9EURY|nr:hypothetical protein [Salinirubellus salinus]UWM54151.1 hypothetical protein N0B31_18790 [Salinirubellus salinus]